MRVLDFRKLSASLLFAPLLSIPAALAAEAVELPEYEPAQFERAALSCVGSDAMGSIMRALADRYRLVQPRIRIDIRSEGSAAAPEALLSGAADLGPMARPLKKKEREMFLAELGVEPVRITIGYGALAVYVSKKNPKDEVSFAELKSIYTRAPGMPAVTWAEFGVPGPFGRNIVSPLVRPKESSFSAFFKQDVLLPDDFAAGLPLVQDDEALSGLMAALPGGIAYGPLATDARGVKKLGVRCSAEGHAVYPARRSIISGEYPLARPLYIYIVQDPERPLAAPLLDFLLFILSKEGQQAVQGQNALPLEADLAWREVEKLR